MSTQPESLSKPVNVLIVDDSAVIRGLMSKALSMHPDIVIQGSAANGQMAVAIAKEHRPDIVILDIEMPVMDGIAALPELLKVSPKSKVIMASTLTNRNADISLKALSLGAVDYLAKPSAKTGQAADEFYRELIGKVVALGGTRTMPITPSVSAPAPSSPQVSTPTVAPVKPLTASELLNPMGTRALAIASSTGGPQALMSVFEQIRGRINGIPIFITQHMPPTFTTILAQHVSTAGKRTCVEAQDGQNAQPGCAYIAPGDFHMLAEKNEQGKVILRINQAPPENFCRPAADPMLRSLSKLYGAQLAVLVLTGMGQDGMEGCKEVVRNGGSVVAQDEASCVVYGMPKAVAEHNLCKAILPLSGIGAFLIKHIDGRTS